MVRIACCQIEPRIGEKNDNVKKTIDFASKAVRNGAKIVIFPELCSTGCQLNSREEAFRLSESIPAGETVAKWESFAKEREIFIAAGLAEEENSRLYNSSVLMGPNGFVGKYRKLHLWYKEKLVFEPGNLGLPIFNTHLGRLAMYICNDMWFPETTRIYSALGVDLILNVSNWVALELSEDCGTLAQTVCVAQAYMNSVFIALANRVGIERGQPFIGNSMIIHPTGRILGGPASADREEIVYADCDLMDARLKKSKTELDHTLHDRRIDVYDSLLGYKSNNKTNF